MASFLQRIKTTIVQKTVPVESVAQAEIRLESLGVPSLGKLAPDDFQLVGVKHQGFELSFESLKHQEFEVRIQSSEYQMCGLSEVAAIHDLLSWAQPAFTEIAKERVQLERAIPLESFILSSQLEQFHNTAIPTENLFDSIPSTGVDTMIRFQRVQEPAEISADLFSPLAKRAKADGKCYTDLQACLQLTSTDKIGGLSSDDSRRSVTGGSRRSNRNAARELSIWDLLFPLLQRPVNPELGQVLDLPHPLYEYQPRGISFLADSHSALLGDDMGTGKTVQTSVAMRILFQKGKVISALIVCPLSVLQNWKRELETWTPNLTTITVRGTKEQREIRWRQPAHVWLTTFDTLRNDVQIALTHHPDGFGLIVLDEAQKIKTSSSGYSKAVRRIKANYRWALTGTPLENRLEDVFGIFDFLKPDLFAPGRYSPSQVNEIIKPYFLRRRKAEVLKDLPDLIENPVWLQLAGEQRESYAKLERDGVLELHARGEAITAQTILVLLGRLKQVCNRCPSSGKSAKLEWLTDNMEEIVAEGDKALVFSQYREANLGGSDWLEEELAAFHPLNYANATTDRQKQSMLTAFNNDLRYSVFIGNPKTAGVGLNQLVAANYVIHFDHWWNPATTDQATARAHRPGQKKKVFAYHLWVSDTYEEAIFNMLDKKKQLYSEVIDSLSISEPERMLFDVWDELLSKHGLNSGGRVEKGS